MLTPIVWWTSVATAAYLVLLTAQLANANEVAESKIRQNVN